MKPAGVLRRLLAEAEAGWQEPSQLQKGGRGPESTSKPLLNSAETNPSAAMKRM